ncbi:hypothetical protein OUZ56_002948 [Daphnia magna]|uniref:Uncharacterized protein n=1 Tax=Daphnia magna TaxID=35525 RepID=A0ABR0A7L3_9CRUS|nr:hypothetical protein OUZ56_002948 [Daphnia magna]
MMSVGGNGGVNSKIFSSFAFCFERRKNSFAFFELRFVLSETEKSVEETSLFINMEWNGAVRKEVS